MWPSFFWAITVLEKPVKEELRETRRLKKRAQTERRGNISIVQNELSELEYSERQRRARGKSPNSLTGRKLHEDKTDDKKVIIEYDLNA